MAKPLFIVFEGGEGMGKSTQAKLLAEALLNEGRSVLVTKEPGGDDSVCHDIRSLLLKPEYKDIMAPLGEFFLFEADRAQHVTHTIKPALEKGTIVIGDRYEASTFAYQCFGHSIPKEYFDTVNPMATGGLSPDFTFWIDADPALGITRNRAVNKNDRFEQEAIAFHQKLRKGLKVYFETRIDPTRYMKLDGTQPIERIHTTIAKKTLELLS